MHQYGVFRVLLSCVPVVCKRHDAHTVLAAETKLPRRQACWSTVLVLQADPEPHLVRSIQQGLYAPLD
jgi:hypothetical protein